MLPMPPGPLVTGLFTAAATLTLSLIAMLSAAKAEASAERGEDLFRKCKSCHSITSPAGDTIVKGSSHGPDLFGVIGRKIGSVPDYRYSPGLVALGEKGMVWDQDNLARFVADPSGFVRDEAGSPAFRSKMTFRLRTGGEDIAAYLATFSDKKD